MGDRILPHMALPDPARLRLASYNLYKANHLDRPGPHGGTLSSDFAELASLREADLVLFQEAMVGKPRPSDPAGDTLAAAAAGLGWEGDPQKGGHTPGQAVHRAFSGSPVRGGGRWGVGILSRYPARFTPCVLPKPWWSPWQRMALLAEVGPWLVGTLHLEVWPIGAAIRRAQMRRVLEAVAAIVPGGDRPVVLAGDFNCERGGPHEELLRAGFVPAPLGSAPTFARATLRLRLDHIYLRNARVEAAGVESQARGSDHWPVWAALRVDTDGFGD